VHFAGGPIGHARLDFIAASEELLIPMQEISKGAGDSKVGAITTIAIIPSDVTLDPAEFADQLLSIFENTGPYFPGQFTPDAQQKAIEDALQTARDLAVDPSVFDFRLVLAIEEAIVGEKSNWLFKWGFDRFIEKDDSVGVRMGLPGIGGRRSSGSGGGGFIDPAGVFTGDPPETDAGEDADTGHFTGDRAPYGDDDPEDNNGKGQGSPESFLPPGPWTTGPHGPIINSINMIMATRRHFLFF